MAKTESVFPPANPHELIKVGVYAFPEHRKQLEMAQQKHLGAMNIIEAITLGILQHTIDLTTTSGIQSVKARLVEIFPALIEYEALRIALGNSPMVFSNDPARAQKIKETMINNVESIALKHLEYLLTDILIELQKYSELPSTSQLLMIAGHQGSGKGVLGDYLATQDFMSLPLSQSVREVTSAWEFDSQQTMDKITTGQLLKEWFGLGILVDLGIFHALQAGQTNIVIDGPRVIEEAEAVRAKGGKIIAIINHPDPEIDASIRRQRIVARAESDPSRTADVEKFDQREKIESPNINRILDMADVTFENSGTPQDLIQKFQTWDKNS